MSFLHNAGKGNNSIVLYLLTIVFVLLSYVLGQLPMIVAVKIVNAGVMDLSFTQAEMIEVLGKNLFLTFALFPFIFSLIALCLSVRFLHKRSILSMFTARESFDWKRFFTSAIIWGGIMGIFLVSAFYASDQIEWNFKPESFFPLLFISLILIPLQTTCEEVLFRGYLFQGFGFLYKKGWVSVVLTGVLFGLMHGANPEVYKLGNIVMIYYIGTGIFLGLLALFDDGLELSLGYHAMNNIFAALILTNDWQAFQTDALFIDHSEPTFGIESLTTIIIVQPLLLLLFSKIYRWTNLKEKIFGSSIVK
jgi:membrane protease YdiL (CAAX protease family)